MPVAPMFSNRQRADESFRRSQATLIGAIAAIKAAKDEEEQRKRQGLQDTLTQQTIAANQMGLAKGQQEAGLVAQMGDQMAPGAAGAALPGDSTMASPFTPAGAAAAGSDFKFSVLSKLRTLRGKEATPEMVKAEYEANRAAADQAQADAVAAPGLRSMELGLKGSQKAHADAETQKTRRETELLGKPPPPKPESAGLGFMREKDLRDQVREFAKDNKETLKTAFAINGVEKALKETGAGGIYEDGDAAGLGFGTKVYRDWLNSKESVKVRQAVNLFMLNKRKENAGTAVTPQEAEVLEKTLGISGKSTVQAFREAMRNFNDETRRTLKQSEAYLSPEATKMIRQNGAFLSADLPGAKDEDDFLNQIIGDSEAGAATDDDILDQFSK